MGPGVPAPHAESFEKLEPGGRVILHEMLYDDRKTGPFSTADMNITVMSPASESFGMR